jgi:iron complex outermembrane receptor protein
MHSALRSALAVALACSLLPIAARAQVQLAQAPDLADLSLEELSNLRVVTATLRPARLSDTPASVYVITNEEIRHSGARSLMEALRLAPNLEVAQVSATNWAISARGFQNVITNKLLVLLDGRTLYTTVLSGVLWDAQDVMLEDVDRIEVISGPGAALYGANAFTGVINIITKSARDTQGPLVSAAGSRIDQVYSVRYGAPLGDGAYRGYAMHIERDNLRPEASHVVDRMVKDQVGFRGDFGPWDAGITLQGDAYHAKVDGNGAPDVTLDGANLLARWRSELPGGSRLRVRAYYDHTRRDDPAGFIDRVDTFDVDLRDNLPAFGAHRVSVGAGYRYALDSTSPSGVLRFIPDERRLRWASVEVQDEIALASDLSLIAGVRGQTDVYIDPVVLPDLRLSWKPREDHLLWIAASAVARTPGRVDRDFFYPSTPPFLIRGGPNFDSETGRTYEIGYRGSPASSLNVSATVFYTQLDDLRGGRLAPDGAGFVIANAVEGHTSGIEAWAMWQAMQRWRLMAGILELHQDLRDKNGSGDLTGPASLGNDPRHTVKLRSSYHASDSLDLDVDWRYVSSLAYLPSVPAYTATDVRATWRVNHHVELGLAVSNLFDRRHVEFDEHGAPAEIPRSTWVQVRCYF